MHRLGVDDNNGGDGDDDDDNYDDGDDNIPHVVVVGRALVPIVLLVVGFQLLIHENGHNRNANAPKSSI